MNIALLNAGLAALLALAVIPPLIHFFAKARPPAYPFSSVELLRRVVRETSRVRRPREWLILILRTLAALAIIGVFLRPLLIDDADAPKPGERRHAVVVVDASASMRAADSAGRTRFAAAVAEAAGFLDGLGPGDTANVVWIDAAPDAVYPALGPNIRFLKDALARKGATMEPGSVDAALRLALGMLNESPEGSREMCVVSDFQATGWSSSALELPKSVRVVRVPVVEADAAPVPNMALTRLDLDPPRPLLGEDVLIRAEVTNFSDAPRTASVFLESGELRLAQDVFLPPWERGAAIFQAAFAESGLAPVTASIDADAFPADDARYAAADVAPSARIRIVSGSEDADRFAADAWRRVVAALDWAEDADTAAGEGGGPDVVMVSGWDGGEQDEIETAPLVAAPAPGASAAELAELLGLPVSAGSGDLGLETLDDPGRVRVAAADADVFAVFEGGEFGDPARGRFRERIRLPDAITNAADAALLVFADETNAPAVLRFDPAGRPPVVVWNVSVDPETSDWAGQPEFVAFTGELLRSLRRAGLADAARPHAEPGSPLAWTSRRDMLADEVTLRSPDADGAPLTTEAAFAESGGTAFVSEAAATPGHYRWEIDGETAALSAVNFPVVESDLRTIDPSNLDAAMRAAASGRAAADLSGGAPLWPWLLAAAVLLAIAESCAVLAARERPAAAASSASTLQTAS